MVVKRIESVARLSGFKYQLYYISAEEHLACYLTSPFFSFFLGRMGIIIGHSS